MKLPTYRHLKKSAQTTLRQFTVPMLGVFLFLFILFSIFFVTRGSVPHSSELRFTEKTSFGEGSVMPASCDSYPHYTNECTPPIGYIDSVDCNYVQGWACDPSDYNAAIDVHVYIDGPAGSGSFIGATNAGSYRPDLGGPCGGNPYHAFAFQIPDYVKNGQNRSYWVHGIDIGGTSNNVLIGNSGWAVTCYQPNPPTVSAWITPGTINYGGSFTSMGYSCGYASYANVYQNGSLVWGGAPTSYTWPPTGPYYSNQNWTFNCVSQDGRVASQTVYLNVRSGSISAPSCSIPVGDSSCNTTVSWTSSSLSSPSFVNQTTNTVVSTAPSGSTGITLTPTPVTFVIKDASDNYTFDTQTVSASCAPGSTWSPSANMCVLTPTASISANPVNSNYGYTSTLTWSGTNAQSCTAGGAWSNSGNISGSGLTDPLTSSQIFTYQCFNYGVSSPIASASVNVCPSSNPVWYNNTCNASPRVVEFEIEGQYTADGKLHITCANADSFVVKKDGVDFRTVNASSGTVNVGTNGNYSVVCMIGTYQGDYSSSQSVMYYQTTPPPPIVTLRASPTTLSPGDESVLSWDVTFPGSVQVPPRTCTLTASPVCANGNCTQAQTDDASALNQILSSGRTDANDLGGANRLISAAINTVVNGNVVTGETDWRAFGKKTVTITKTTDFLLWCGNNPGESQQVRVKVTSSNEG